MEISTDETKLLMMLGDAIGEGRPHGRSPKMGMCECAWCCLYDYAENMEPKTDV